MHDLSWRDEYSIGHPFIDHEHQHLFKVALEAFKPVPPAQKKQKVKDTMLELNHYMTTHFEHEESLMRIIDYPELNEHIVSHQVIIENINKLFHKLPTMSISEFEKELAHFIDASLVTHILEDDAKIQKWYEVKKDQKHVVQWNSQYEIGEESIDEEHQRLFHTANKAFKISQQENTDKNEVKKILIELVTYVQEHFRHEEEFMHKIEFPQLKHHHEIHEKIISEMNKFIKEMATTDIIMFELQLAIFIEKWLVQHIMYEDKKIKSFLEKDKEEIIILDTL